VKQPTSSLGALWSVFWRALLVLPLFGVLFPLLLLLAFGPFVAAIVCWLSDLWIEGVGFLIAGLLLRRLLRPALRVAWVDEYWLGGRGRANI
jgi:hypothetical protein